MLNHMKKIISGVLCFILLCTSTVSASDTNVETISPGTFEIAAKSGVLMDETTGTILFEKNSHEKMPPASITKIMTMILVMEAIDSNKIALTDMVTVSAHACSMGGTQIWLKENEQMSVDHLLKACAVASANDAAMALAEFVGGSEEGFVAMMNNKAVQLKMDDTTFVNPTGLDAVGHMSSAYDIALMSRELLKHEKITEYTSIWMDTLRDGKTQLVNTNKLVRFYKGCTGLKTGTTNGAGACVSVSAKREQLSLISVVMGCNNSNERFESARKLLDHGFSSYEMYDATVSKDILKPVKVLGGTKMEVDVETNNAARLIIDKGSKKKIEQTVDICSDVEAPVLKGQKLGGISLMIDGKEIASFEIKAKTDVPKMTIFTAFSSLFKRLVTM